MAAKHHRVGIVIPSTVNGNEAVPVEAVAEWVKAAKVKMASLFGGFTAYSAVGGWLSPVHGLIEEPVVIVASFTDEGGLKRLPEVKALAAEMGGALGQEAVAIEVDHSLQFVPPLAAVAA